MRKLNLLIEIPDESKDTDEFLRNVVEIETMYKTVIMDSKLINMPTDEEIFKVYEDAYSLDPDFIEGAKWMRDYLMGKVKTYHPE